MLCGLRQELRTEGQGRELFVTKLSLDMLYYTGGEEQLERDGSTGGSGSSTGPPQLHPCESGGYYVDPSTVSNSPIKTFTRIRDLAPGERDSYYNQFSHTKSRRSRGNNSGLGESSRANMWGGSDFDNLQAGEVLSIPSL